MYSENKLILQLISLMKAHNVNKVVVAPGTRHFPFVHSLKADKYFKLYSVVDERSAAFFALGLILKTGDPVAVCCTSGTASINFSPAVCEAYYQNQPLVVITADRLPELLDQQEDQMIRQIDIYKDFVKYRGQLPVINSDLDEWYANRIINEAFIELNHHGKGPVHLNYPIFKHNTDTFQTKTLPVARKISHHSADCNEKKWKIIAERLRNKQVMIIWGQSNQLSDNLKNSLDKFCEKYNCVILKDKISNLHQKNSIDNSLCTLRALSVNEKKELQPEIVISVGGNVVFNDIIKAYLKLFQGQFENWQLSLKNKVSDPYWHLTDMFEMSEDTFFKKLSEQQNNNVVESKYYKLWSRISNSISEPNSGYSELYAIGKLLKSIPEKSILHIGNSNPIRMVQLFDFDRSIECYCNRGTHGIDGCMSTAVGFASESDKLNFLIVGDLTFFYDMNAVWNRHLSKNLRILLLNNGGGAVMHYPFNKEIGKTLPTHNSAGHTTSARGWVESLGIDYISARNSSELGKGLEKFTDPGTKGPVLMEVFTDKEKDTQLLKNYYKEIDRTTFAEKVKRKTENTVSKYLRM